MQRMKIMKLKKILDCFASFLLMEYLLILCLCS